ncbi:MAG: hypothetical protein AAFN77_10920 [Planctomycetota bacterium]
MIFTTSSFRQTTLASVTQPLRNSVLFLLVGIVLLTNLTSQTAAASDASQQLSSAVRKMNYWLIGDAEAEGWRRFLMLNVLETQVAKGPHADIGALKMISDRFHSGASGLNHPRFVEVREAIDQQLLSLSSTTSLDPAFAISEARGRYRKITVSVMAEQRDAAVEELEFLIRHYRNHMPSRDRANLFYDLKLDEVKATLGSIEFELAPEVSVGKIDSMIRDLRDQLDDIEAKLDALPFLPEPDETPQPDQPPADQAAPGDSVEGKLQETDGPSEDDSQESRQDLEKRQLKLEKEVQELRSKQRQVARDDKPRRDRRTQNFRAFLRLEANFVNASKTETNPVFVSAAAAYERFVRTYVYGTEDNLQEDYLKRLSELDKQLGRMNGPESRQAAGLIGDHLRWLENANQAPELVNTFRFRFSQPNAIFSVSSSLINQLAARPINDSQPVRQNVGGRLLRGNLQTNAMTTIDLVNDPNQVHASIHLLGTVNSNTYVQQGKLQVFTQTNGDIEARQSIYANVGGFFAGEPKVAANFRADFLGTTSRLRLVNRIAAQQVEKARADGEAEAARQAEEQLLEQVVDQTEPLIKDGQEKLAERLKKALTESSDKLPEIYLYSTSDRIVGVARKDSISTLAAGTSPVDYGVRPQIAVRVHDSMLSNFLEKTFAGKTFTDSEIAEQITELFGETPKALTGEAVEGEEQPEPFSITFAATRPIQFEFEDQGFSVVVSGRRFSQGNKQINEGLNIILRFRIRSQNGKLQLIRNGDVDFSYPDEQRTPKVVGFKSFLDGRLNKDLEAQDTDVDLPDNLLPLDQVELLKDSPIAKRLRLVQFRSENGWLYIGWNLAPEYGYDPSWIYDLPGIWNEATIMQLDSSFTPQPGQ